MSHVLCRVFSTVWGNFFGSDFEDALRGSAIFENLGASNSHAGQSIALKLRSFEDAPRESEIFECKRGRPKCLRDARRAGAVGGRRHI